MSILSMDLATASIAELKDAARTIQQARFIAECREHGHDHADLIPTPVFDPDGKPVTGGDPTGITCTRCSATWTLLPGMTAAVPAALLEPDPGIVADTARNP